MRIKKKLNLTTQDFWYDLFDGGYLNPSKICLDKDESKSVYNAMNILLDFRESIGEAYPEFYQ